MSPASPVPLPLWVRPAIPGEALEDWRERRCISSRCGAVFRRARGQSAESWESKQYCSGSCFNGLPPIAARSNEK